MKARFNKAIATLTLMIMIMTLMVPVGAFAAPTKENADYTFNIMFGENAPEQESEPAPGEPGTGDEDDQGQAIILDREKIRILEIYPHTIENVKEEVNDMDVISRLRGKSKYEVTTMSINRLISLKDEINGKYDVVYFNGGEYTRNYVWEHSYGSDITNLCADKLKEFIESGQLCIFHEDIFNKTAPLGNETILKQQFESYIYNQAYPNVIVVTNNEDNGDGNKEYKVNVINSLYDRYADTQQGVNPRPILRSSKRRRLTAQPIRIRSPTGFPSASGYMTPIRL